MPPPPGRGDRNLCPTPLVLVRILPKYVFNIAEKFEILKSREDEKRNNQKKNLDQAFQEDVKILGNGENNGD